MASDVEQLYGQRLKRYVTAMQNGRPDRIPIRPFVAEFIATYTGFTCQDVTQDYQKAFEATRICCRDFDWDATVANMVYIWGGDSAGGGIEVLRDPGGGAVAEYGVSVFGAAGGGGVVHAGGGV